MQHAIAQKKTTYNVLWLIALAHLFNDTLQAVVPAMNVIFQSSLGLSYTQIGFITFTLNLTASVIQPVVGIYTDKRPAPFALPLGQASTLIGMVVLAFAPSYIWIIIGVICLGIGSAVFHPEGARVAHMASGPRRGLAQSIYQVGGNAGQSLAPLIVGLLLTIGQRGAMWFALVALASVIVLMYVSRWSSQRMAETSTSDVKGIKTKELPPITRWMKWGLILLIIMVFTRSFYHAAFLNYYSFYLIHDYGLDKQTALMYLFIFLAAGAVGTFLGGPIADRFGHKSVIVFSILGALPLALVTPYLSTNWLVPALAMNGFIILSSFSVTVVYAQELLPGRVGLASGLIVGLAFGMGALGAAVLGWFADITSLKTMIQAVSFLPILGFAALLLPSDRRLLEMNLSSQTHISS
ncbi:MFS transporter [Litoribacterium kuwaitense]|uniref:MFS transporter n=1 Tax=Litoribacterium kuwaitense TaxID=1398745 RepID=UPI0028AAC433|nr:MFS transporter [Litoribacterium kuwaitense]